MRDLEMKIQATAKEAEEGRIMGKAAKMENEDGGIQCSSEVISQVLLSF
jgi:hypothetical protein